MGTHILGERLFDPDTYQAENQDLRALSEGEVVRHFDIGAAAPLDHFDFVVCSHVMEHLDSLFRGIENALRLVRSGGIVYIAVPCRNFDQDRELIPDYGLDHHRRDYEEPGKSRAGHDGTVGTFGIWQ